MLFRRFLAFRDKSVFRILESQKGVHGKVKSKNESSSESKSQSVLPDNSIHEASRGRSREFVVSRGPLGADIRAVERG
jgi:hypothetical protein